MSINIIKNNRFDNNKYISGKKFRNEIVNILTKLKNLSLLKSKSRNLFWSKKV